MAGMLEGMQACIPVGMLEGMQVCTERGKVLGTVQRKVRDGMVARRRDRMNSICQRSIQTRK